MLTPYEEAFELLIQRVERLSTERVLLWNALGRVLAEDVYADRDNPAFDNSAMDGYAIRSEDLENLPARLKVVGEVPAGGEWKGVVERGCAIKIFTGAPIPNGADAVVPVEFVREEGEYIIVEKPFKKGANVRYKGEEIKAGDILLKAGTRIRGYEIGLLAFANKVFVEVYQRPRVAILSTGDEIKEPGETIEKPSQIRSTNNHLLYAKALELGCEVHQLGIVPDNPELIAKALERVEDYHVFITTGGVSAGDKDFVHKLVKEMGFEVVFHKLRIKPAKPVLFAKKDKTLFFGLPGNPVSCAMAFDLLVKPALLKMQGVENFKPQAYKAELLRDFSRRDAERREFVRARFIQKDGKLYCDYSPKTQSHMLTSYVDANCYMVVYEEVKEIKAGQAVEILPFDW
ncbi:MAG: molybdopterin molybdotransferase MoeA [Pyrobaculum arsenaticum]|uniref:molybdopterin molybdotransferase MoeA n=1 Tax=Pyrobaculum arsenaticum TaxID=121277 RepID=UPI002273F19B|nr:molybdopterin molybdotransferase MoeA [Pyrobaculum arsenaticum]